MPLYEYQCSQCGRRTEKRQKFADAALTDCPFCGGALKKLISAPAIQFKGGGWFADGYGNAKSSSNASADGGTSSTPSGDGSAAKSDAKSSGSGESSSSAKSTGSSSDSSSSSAAASTSSASSSSAGSSDK